MGSIHYWRIGLMFFVFFAALSETKGQTRSVLAQDIDSLSHSPWNFSKNPAGMAVSRYSFSRVQLSSGLLSQKELKRLQEPEKALYYGLSTLRSGVKGKLSYTGWLSYRRDEEVERRWNAMFSNQVKTPYFVADSLSGEMSKESYGMGGKVSLELSKVLQLGLGFDFLSGKMWGTADPRPNNSLSNLEGSLGLLWRPGDLAIGLSVFAGQDKERVKRELARENERTDFYLFKGLGQHDPNFSANKESASMNYETPGWGVNFQFSSEKKNRSFLELSLRNALQSVTEPGTSDVRTPYKYQIREFEARQQFIHPLSEGFYRINAGFGWYTGRGLERVYERRDANEEGNVRKWALLSESTRYYKDVISADLNYVWRSCFSDKFYAELAAGAVYRYRKEMYVEPDYFIEQRELTPQLGFMAQYTVGKHQISGQFFTAYRKVLTKDFQLNQALTGVAEMILPDLEVEFSDRTIWQIAAAYERPLAKVYRWFAEASIRRAQASGYRRNLALELKTGLKF